MAWWGSLRSWVKRQAESRPLLRDVTILASGTAAAQAVSILVALVTARLFTPAAFGGFAIYGSLTGIVITIAALRFDMAVMLPDDEDEARVVAKLAARLILGFSVAASVGGLLLRDVVVAVYGDRDLAAWLPFSGLTVFFVASATLMQYWFNRTNQYGVISINRVQQTIGSAGGQLGFGLAGFRSMGGLLLGTMCGQAIAYVNLRRKSSAMRLAPAEGTATPRQLAARYRQMPLLNLPAALVDSVRLNGISLLIGAFSLGSVGQFNLAWRVLQVPIILINGAISQVFFERLARVRRGEMLPLVRAAIRRALLLSVPSFAVLYLAAPWLFVVAFGEQWSMAGDFARAIIPWLMMQLVTSPVSTVFVVTQTQQWMLAFSVAFAAVPLTLLSVLTEDLMRTMTIVGLSMGGMLVVMLVMAIAAARRYDADAPNEASTKEE